jgi:hypothetical protein
MKYVKLAALTRALTTPVQSRPSLDEAPPSTRRVPPSTRSAAPISVDPKTVRERHV